MSKKAAAKTLKTLKKSRRTPKKTLDIVAVPDVKSPSSSDVADRATLSPLSETQEHSIMQITLVKSTKERKSTAVSYGAAGYAGSVRFSKSFFADKAGPDSLIVDNDAFGAPRTPRAKMTAEERRAANAARPKLTPQQRLDAIEARAAKLREKIASSAA